MFDLVTNVLSTRLGHVSVLACVFLAAYAFFSSLAIFTHNALFHPLSKFPGPISHAGSAIPEWWALWNGRDHSHKKMLHDKYGPVVRVAPNTLSYNTAEGWRDIYAHVQGRKQIPKDLTFYLPENVHGQRSLINADDEDHARMRRLISHAFSATALKEQEEILNKYFDLLISQLKAKIASPAKGKIDLAAWYNYATWDIIGDLSMGSPFGMLATSAPHAYMTRLTKGSKHLIIVWTGVLFPIFGLFLRLLITVLGMSNARSRQNAFAVELVANRLKAETDRKDFMSYILRYNESDERGMTLDEINKTSKTLINAGSETTATALPGATYLLLTHPTALEKVTKEVRGKFTSAEEITLQSTSAKALPYLFAVVEETLRLYPPVSFAFPRRTVVPTEICGEVIPPGVRVGVHQYATYHSSSNFAAPETFVPERWMGDERFASDKRDAFQPFSRGARNCLGKNLAYAEMTSILARMLFHFDMHLCPESERWMEGQKAYLMWERPPLMVRLELARNEEAGNGEAGM